MSHYSVIVRLPESAIEEKGLESALDAAMRPYYEQGEPSDDFMQFQDCTEEVEKAWDDLHKDQAPGSENRKKLDKYRSIDRFGSEYYGYNRDENGKFGYYSNPNAKWDWYSIGGRWTGYFPLKEQAPRTVGRPGLMTSPAESNKGDVVHLDDIDMDAVSTESKNSSERFIKAWLEYASDPMNDGGDPFRDEICPRSTGLDMGLVVVRQGAPEPGEESRARKWSDIHARLPEDDERRRWHDIVADVSEDELRELASDHFCSIRPYAYLDEAGWHEPGKMGWFGCDNATPESRREHSAVFLDWLKSTPSDCLLIAVDCHI